MDNAERAEYGATELMFHPRVIILPGVIQGHWDGWRQDVSKNKAFKENRALGWRGQRVRNGAMWGS